LFLICCAATSGLLVLLFELEGRIADVGFGWAPLLTRESCPINNLFTSYASKGSGVRDDLAWTDKQLVVQAGNLLLLTFLRRKKEPTLITFSLSIKFHRFSSQIVALITLPQRVIGAWMASSAPSEDEEEIIFSISTKTCSGGSEGD